MLIWNYFALAFSALLPVINPLGSALVFLGLVGPQPSAMYKSLARRIAINTVLFFAIIELAGSAILSFFGISIAIVQVAGGLVLASMGWKVLNEQDAKTAQLSEKAESTLRAETEQDDIQQKAFYPLTFPVTAGPACIVVMLTLSAHASRIGLEENILAHLGVFLAVVILSGVVYLSYAYAPMLSRAISPSTSNGILRVVAFILLCIGVQIAWNGFDHLLSTFLPHVS